MTTRPSITVRPVKKGRVTVWRIVCADHGDLAVSAIHKRPAVGFANDHNRRDHNNQALVRVPA